MTATLGSKTLNLLSLNEISDVKAVKTDRWENGYKRHYATIGLLRKWRLECIEKNAAWDESAIKYLEEQAAQATKLDFTADLGDLYNVNTQVQVLGCRQRFNPLGEANIRRFTVTLMEAQPFTINPDQSCILYLPLDEGAGGTAYDKSGYDNNGTIYGATWMDGKYGKALSFDGVDDYVEVADSASLDITRITVCLWIKFNDLDRLWQRIIEKGTYHGGSGFYIMNGYNNKLYAEVFPGGENSIPGYTNRAFETGRWYHIAVTYDGSHAKWYVDGELDRSVEATDDMVPNDRNLCIASDRGTKYFFNGVIDEVRIYNRALSAEEIRQLYLSGAIRVDAEMLMPTDVSENFELVGGEWDAYKNESYIRKLAVLGQKRTWRITFIEKNVPWSYSAAKHLQYKAWRGEPVYFRARLSSRYETEEVEAYVTGLELNIPNIAGRNIRRFTVTLKEA